MPRRQQMTQHNYGNLTKEIVEYFFQNFKLKAKSDTTILFNSKTYTARQFEKLLSLTERELLVNLTPESQLAYLSLTKAGEAHKLVDKVFLKINNILLEKARQEASDPSIRFNLEGTPYDYSDHFQVIDIETDARHLFYKKKEIMTNLHIDAWKEWLNMIDSNVKKAVLQSTVFGFVTYDPYEMRTIGQVVVNGQSIPQFNAHSFPDWRKTKLENPKLPEKFVKFMDYCFPDAASKKYVLAWMRNMLVDRNQCHLLLHGKKGIGKNTFAMICEKLVGSINYKLIDPKFWEGRFNGELKYKRLCYFDEHDITPDNIGQLKAYANEFISIEEKNVKVEKNYKNFASFIIANNNPSGNFLSSDDRRFSVPVLNSMRMDHALGSEFIVDLYDTIRTDEEFIANIGWWLLENENKTYDAVTPFKSELFYNLVENALADWQRKLIDLIKSKEYEEIEVSDLSSILSINISIGHVKICKFLENHTDEKGEFYAKVSRGSRKSRVIVPIGEYAIEGSDSVDKGSFFEVDLSDF